MQCVFRRLGEADISLVMAMNRDFREGFACEESARAFLKNPRNWVFAAILDGAVIGFADGYELERLDGQARMLYIHEIGVTERHQRQGVGFAMMRALKEACRAAGIGKYYLWTCQNNVGANALYRKLGGEVCHESQGEDVIYFFRTK